MSHALAIIATPANASNTAPAWLTTRPNGATFSTRTKTAMAAIQSRFITPPTKSSTISPHEHGSRPSVYAGNPQAIELNVTEIPFDDVKGLHAFTGIARGARVEFARTPVVATARDKSLDLDHPIYIRHKSSSLRIMSRNRWNGSDQKTLTRTPPYVLLIGLHNL